MAFDFDGTLVQGDAGVHFALHRVGREYREAFGGGLVPSLFKLAKAHWHATSLTAQALYLHARYATGHYDRHRMVERAYQGFAGLPASQAREELATFAREHLPGKLREGVIDQMREHAQRGDHVVVLSTGVRDLIWPLREVLGIDFEVVACRLREEAGELTGTAEGPLNGSEKATRLLAIAKRRAHDLGEAWAYSDHEDDAVILDMVGNPVAVHPTKAMHGIARERGWPILWDG